MSSKPPDIKSGQVHHIDKRASRELEETIVRLNNAGSAIKTLHNVLIEIDIEENTDGDGFLHLETYEKYNIQTAMRLLGDLVNMETYRIAERFGLQNPC